MTSPRFTASLLRASSSGYAALTAARLFERPELGDALEGQLEAWRAHFESLVLELAAALDDGSPEQFATRIEWTRDAFETRGLGTEALRLGLRDLTDVLRSALPTAAAAHLDPFLEHALRAVESGGPDAASEVSGAAVTETLGHEYVERLLAGERDAAFEVVLSALRDGRVTAEQALADVLTSALREVGALWHRDRIGVGEEHFATLTTYALIERVLLAAPAPAADGHGVVLGMVEGDGHDLALRLVAALFELAGWRTIALGANVPVADLVRTVERLEPDVVVLGATLNTQREATARTVAALRASGSARPIVVGGGAFGGHEAQVGADACARDMREAVRLATELASR